MSGGFKSLSPQSAKLIRHGKLKHHMDRIIGRQLFMISPLRIVLEILNDFNNTSGGNAICA